jgi:hypothetical protein
LSVRIVTPRFTVDSRFDSCRLHHWKSGVGRYIWWTVVASPMTVVFVARRENSVDSKLLDKIEKIVKLQEGAATQGEAQAAAAALQRLLTQHNIEMAEVHRRLGSKVEPATITSKRFDCKQANWLRSLWFNVARANEADCFYSGNTITIIAHNGKHDQIARQVDSLVATINRLAPRAYREYAYGRSWPTPSRSWTNSYKWGFVAGLRQALHEAKQEVVAQYAGGSALVLVQEQEVADYMSRNYRSLTSSKATYGTSGFSQGRTDGYAHGGSRTAIG